MSLIKIARDDSFFLIVTDNSKELTEQKDLQVYPFLI